MQIKTQPHFRDADIIEMRIRDEFSAVLVAVRQPISQPGENSQVHPQTAIVDL